jgi:hypothetical protein
MILAQSHKLWKYYFKYTNPAFTMNKVCLYFLLKVSAFLLFLHLKINLPFILLTNLPLSVLFFWVLMLCGLVGRYLRFGGTYCLHPQRQYVSLKRYLPTSPHGVTSQKNNIVFIVERMSDIQSPFVLKYFMYFHRFISFPVL